jgi:plastocyanin
MSIGVQDNFFSVTTDTVAAGSTVTWTWMGTQQHSVTFDAAPSSSIQSTGTFSRNFAAQGTFNYHCLVHGAAMSGVIVVQ